jgi:hypothetical protein
MPEDDALAIPEFRWIIDARSQVQDLLLRLYRIGSDWPVEDDKDIGRSYTYLVGAAFSLWRAAFLTDADRSLSKIVRGDFGALTLLRTLIKDNAVNYPQDRKTRGWMVGYYLNSARLRLAHTRKFLPEADQSPQLAKFLALHQEGIAELPPPTAWDTIYEAASAMVDTLSSVLLSGDRVKPTAGFSSD